MNRLIDQLLAAALIGVFFGPYVKFSQFLGVRSGNTETGTKIKNIGLFKDGVWTKATWHTGKQYKS